MYGLLRLRLPLATHNFAHGPAPMPKLLSLMIQICAVGAEAAAERLPAIL